MEINKSDQARRFKKLLSDNGYSLCNKDGRDLTPAELSWLMGSLYLIVREDRVEPEDRENYYNNQFILNISIPADSEEHLLKQKIRDATSSYCCDGEYQIKDTFVFTYTFKTAQELRLAHMQLNTNYDLNITETGKINISVECPLEDQSLQGYGCTSGCHNCSKPTNEDKE